MFHGVTPIQTRKWAFEFAAARGIEYPEFLEIKRLCRETMGDWIS